MVKVIDIYKYIDSFAPFITSASFDNTGILVGNSEQDVTKVIVSLDITKDVVEEAVNKKAQLIVSHHPVIFNPIKSLPFDSVPALLIRNNLSAICAHTNLDISSEFGVNTCLAEMCGLCNCTKSDKGEVLFIAFTENGITAAQLAQKIKYGLGCERVAYTCVNENIEKVGVSSGAGGSEIFSAIAENCDAFITGEIKHHEIIAANEAGVSIFCVGHYKSEDIVINPLAQKLSQKFDGVEFIKSEVFNDKIQFV